MMITASSTDKRVIRELAKNVADIARDHSQREKQTLWTRLNRLERTRPLVQVQLLDDSIWSELLPESQYQTSDVDCREQEKILRKKIWCWENLPDDRVVDDTVRCPLALQGPSMATLIWLDHNGTIARRRNGSLNLKRSDMKFGAYSIEAVIKEEKDIDFIPSEPKVEWDEEETERRFEWLSDLYGGILRVEKRGPDFMWLWVMDQFIYWRGIEQMFVDLVERPAWIHEALERITQLHLRSVDELERLGALSPGNGNTWIGSGGFAWTDQLPQPGHDGEHVRAKDLWGRCATQIFTQGISAEMHDEFAIQYEQRLLERFGLAAYGCCEPLHNKLHLLRKISNLRRVSMSPWADIEVGAQALGKDYIFTHKPHPSVVSMAKWDPELARRQLRDALEKTRENVVEIVLQDIHTVRNEPHRLTEWTCLARELAEEYA